MNEIVCNSKPKWNHHECQRECKELEDWSSCKDDYMWNPSACYCKCNKPCNIDKYFDIKNCSCKKHHFGKLVLACEDEILNTTETLLDDKKVTCEKSNCLIHIISLVIISTLLLTVVSTGCCYYYTKYWKKQKH